MDSLPSTEENQDPFISELLENLCEFLRKKSSPNICKWFQRIYYLFIDLFIITFLL